MRQNLAQKAINYFFPDVILKPSHSVAYWGSILIVLLVAEFFYLWSELFVLCMLITKQSLCIFLLFVQVSVLKLKIEIPFFLIKWLVMLESLLHLYNDSIFSLASYSSRALFSNFISCNYVLLNEFSFKVILPLSLKLVRLSKILLIFHLFF